MYLTLKLFVGHRCNNKYDKNNNEKSIAHRNVAIHWIEKIVNCLTVFNNCFHVKSYK